MPQSYLKIQYSGNNLNLEFLNRVIQKGSTHISHGLVMIYEVLAFNLALSVYLPKDPSLQEWTLNYQAKIWIQNIFLGGDWRGVNKIDPGSQDPNILHVWHRGAKHFKIMTWILELPNARWFVPYTYCVQFTVYSIQYTV